MNVESFGCYGFWANTSDNHIRELLFFETEHIERLGRIFHSTPAGEHFCEDRKRLRFGRGWIRSQFWRISRSNSRVLARILSHLLSLIKGGLNKQRGLIDRARGVSKRFLCFPKWANTQKLQVEHNGCGVPRFLISYIVFVFQF